MNNRGCLNRARLLRRWGPDPERDARDAFLTSPEPRTRVASARVIRLSFPRGPATPIGANIRRWNEKCALFSRARALSRPKRHLLFGGARYCSALCWAQIKIKTIKRLRRSLTRAGAHLPKAWLSAAKYIFCAGWEPLWGNLKTKKQKLGGIAVIYG